MTVGSQPREFNFGAGNPDPGVFPAQALGAAAQRVLSRLGKELAHYPDPQGLPELRAIAADRFERNHRVRPSIADRKSTRLNSSHRCISYAVFCLKKKT